MPLLAFDTATRATAVALQAADGAPAVEARDDPPAGARPRHAACLLPLIAEVLDRAGTSWEQLERIAVGIGPGTFTGLRIGIATARALGQALAVPLVSIPTLRSLAASVERASLAEDRPEAVVSVLDARRGEVFAAAWSVAERGLVPVFGVRALKPARLGELLAGSEHLVPDRTVAVGDGAVTFREILEPSGVVIPDDDSEHHRVAAVTHCRLGWSLPESHPNDVHPCYVRLPDAELGRRALESTR